MTPTEKKGLKECQRNHDSTSQWKNGPFEDVIIFYQKTRELSIAMISFSDFGTFSQGSFFFLNDVPFPQGWRCDRSHDFKGSQNPIFSAHIPRKNRIKSSPSRGRNNFVNSEIYKNEWP